MGLRDHPETYLLKALFRHRAPSWLKVGGWWWWVVAPGIILSSPGTGCRETLYFHFPISNSQFPIPIPISSPQSQAQAQAQSQSLDNKIDKEIQDEKQ